MCLVFTFFVWHLAGICISTGVGQKLLRTADGNQYDLVVMGDERLGVGICFVIGVVQEVHIFGISPALL